MNLKVTRQIDIQVFFSICLPSHLYFVIADQFDWDPLQTPSKRSAPNDVVETGSSLKKQKFKEKIHEDKNEKKEKHDKKDKP